MKTAALFLLLVLLAPLVRAEDCAGPGGRSEIMSLISHAGEDRPVSITFATRADGVKIPPELVSQYPDEMTVILQYEFDHLVVTKNGIEVGLWFNRRFARLAIPFAAIRAVYDDRLRKCAAG
jgi:hypothetical protein